MWTFVSTINKSPFNAKWLNPQLGRFSQADSIVPAGVQGYDRYAFVNNNPVRYVDPSGHRPCDDQLGCGGGGNGGGGGGNSGGIGSGKPEYLPNEINLSNINNKNNTSTSTKQTITCGNQGSAVYCETI